MLRGAPPSTNTHTHTHIHTHIHKYKQTHTHKIHLRTHKFWGTMLPTHVEQLLTILAILK